MWSRAADGSPYLSMLLPSGARFSNCSAVRSVCSSDGDAGWQAGDTEPKRIDDARHRKESRIRRMKGFTLADGMKPHRHAHNHEMRRLKECEDDTDRENSQPQRSSDAPDSACEKLRHSDLKAGRG